jgi:hypothetical protein
LDQYALVLDIGIALDLDMDLDLEMNGDMVLGRSLALGIWVAVESDTAQEMDFAVEKGIVLPIDYVGKMGSVEIGCTVSCKMDSVRGSADTADSVEAGAGIQDFEEVADGLEKAVVQELEIGDCLTGAVDLVEIVRGFADIVDGLADGVQD